jgi:hypothetical protein
MTGSRDPMHSPLPFPLMMHDVVRPELDQFATV